MTSRLHPDADGATQYKYDDLGRLRFSQDARQKAAGKVTYTVYDDFGRVTRVGEGAFTGTFASLDPDSSYTFESGASWRSRMTYDDDHAAVGPNYVRGRLTKIEENTDADAAAEVTHRYAYDGLGNVRVKKVSLDGLSADKTVRYVHDFAGRLTRLVYPDGGQARYAYDGAGRLTRVWDAEGNTLTAYTHTAAGNVKTHVVGDGAGEGVATGTYAYNAREWVTDLNYTDKFRSTLTYDRVGNVTRQVYRHGTAAAKTADYAYDDLHRITDFDPASGVSQDFAYDRNGNVTRVVTGSSTLTYNYSSGSTPNRLDSTTGTGGETFGYNKNGWVTTRGANTLTYDYRGLTTGYGSAAYLMDPDRRRVKKTVGTATTFYLRGSDGSVLAEYDGKQALTARYVYAGSRRIARIAGSSHRYYLADHLGSTRALVDESGSVTATYDYRPYGKVLASSGTDATRFRFTGHERDVESSLDYMLARSYAYDVGRFLRPDPMQDEYPGLSPYAYANNNPLKYVDPDGRVIKLASSLNSEEKARLQGYLSNLQKSRTGKLIYNEVHGSDLVFTIGFDENLPEDKGGKAEIDFDEEETVRDPRTNLVTKASITGGRLSIAEEGILGSPGNTIEGILGHEIYHAWQALDNPARYKNLEEKAEREKLGTDEQVLEIEAYTIQGIIERELERQRRKEEESR